MAYIILMVAALIADQLTKYLVRSNMAVGESISVIGDFFRLTHYENDGAAFSSLSGQRAILIIIPSEVLKCICLSHLSCSIQDQRHTVLFHILPFQEFCGNISFHGDIFSHT